MPPLVRFLLGNFAIGALLGLGCAVGVVLTTQGADRIVSEPLGFALVAWGFASTFGLGYLATALAAPR